MNANEIARGLRYCYSEDMVRGCNECPYYNHEDDTCTTENLELQAADLIESLQAQLEQFNATLAREGFTELETMIAKYKTVILAANELSIETDEEIEALREQLKESQRREKAARIEVCRCCPDGEIIDGVKHYPCDGCEWRGPEIGE